MIHFYLQIKSVHVHLALWVGLVFVALFLTTLLPRLKGLRTPVKYLSWTTDVCLLTAAMMLLTILPGALYANGWLLVKLVALGGFVACRHLMIRQHPPLLPRWGWLVLGGALLGYAYGVARDHHPLGYFSRFLG